MKNNFDNIFSSIFTNEKFEVRQGKPYSQNVGDLQRLAFLKHDCKYIYNHLASTFGEDYGEKILRGIESGLFTIVNPEKFTYKDFPYTEESVYLSLFCNKNSYNFLNIFSEVSQYIFKHIKYGNSISLPDLFIILSMLFARFKKNKTCSWARFKNMPDKYRFATQVINNFLFSIAGMTGDLETQITLPIMDEVTYKDFVSQKDIVYTYSVFNLEGNQRSKTIKAIHRYKDYIKFIRFFMRCLRSFEKHQAFKPFKIVFYIHSNKDVRRDMIDKVCELTTVFRAIVAGNFRKVYLGKGVNLDDPEYQEIINYFIKLNRGTITAEELKAQMYLVLQNEKDFFEDRTVYEKVPMYKFISKVKLNADISLLVYNKRVEERVFEHKRAETLLDFSKIFNDEFTDSDLKQHLIESYIDAQAINQTRLTVFKGINYTDCRCNVKVINVPEQYIPNLFNTLYEETKYLRSAYGVDFTFEIQQVKQ